jgi:putative addiction module killer protein
MLEVRKTQQFDQWLDHLRDRLARVRVLARVDRLALGNPGQHRVLAGGVVEMKIDFGPGYRVYFSQHGQQLLLLLVGGDKASQSSDIALALRLAKEWQP